LFGPCQLSGNICGGSASRRAILPGSRKYSEVCLRSTDADQTSNLEAFAEAASGPSPPGCTRPAVPPLQPS
jgi:hypothetical protein